MGNRPAKRPRTTLNGFGGSYVGKQKSPALHAAVDLEDTGQLISMVKKGFDVNKRDASGMTPLHCAALNGNEDCAKILLKAGAEIRSAQLYLHPIHFAAQGGFVNMVKLLLDHGDGINATDSIGNSPLDLAVESDHPECVNLLLSRGAYIQPRTMKTAIESGSVDCLKTIILYKPSLLKSFQLKPFRFTQKSMPCLQLMLSVGFRFDLIRFREDHRPFEPKEFIADNRILQPPPFYNFKKDNEAFEEFMDEIDNLSEPQSLMNLAQWSFYIACNDRAVKDVISEFACPKFIASFLLLER
ncbi:Ankyrin-2 [Halotydeus destructor]|nr:Ankyrin-2 [Halotydeus destructor]